MSSIFALEGAIFLLKKLLLPIFINKIVPTPPHILSLMRQMLYDSSLLTRRRCKRLHFGCLLVFRIYINILITMVKIKEQ